MQIQIQIFDGQLFGCVLGTSTPTFGCVSAFFLRRGCPTCVIANIGDCTLRAFVAAAVAMIDAAIGIDYHRDGKLRLVINAVRTEVDTSATLGTGQNINDGIPVLAINAFLQSEQ